VVATPVGPVPSDADDPDLWDWSGDEQDDRSSPRRHPGRAIVAAVLIGMMVLLVLASIL